MPIHVGAAPLGDDEKLHIFGNIVARFVSVHAHVCEQQRSWVGDNAARQRAAASSLVHRSHQKRCHTRNANASYIWVTWLVAQGEQNWDLFVFRARRG